MHAFTKSTLLTILASTLITSQGYAYCARCSRIEADRAKEQAEHPQPFHYYEDDFSKEISLNEESPSSSENNKGLYKTGSSGTKAEGKGSGALSGSTSRSSTTSDMTNKPDEIKTEESLDQFDTSSDQPQTRRMQKKSGMGIQGSKSQMLSLNDTQSTIGYAKTASNQPYSTVLTILQTKDFLNTLCDSFTFFIPINEAFRHLGPLAIQDLLRPENKEQLSALVSSHVVAQKILKKDFNQAVKTLNGHNLTLQAKGDDLTVNGIRVLRTEPAGDNGIIYIIDQVLMP
ncbi:fasciclin domain-containing protein [Candidatus Protochlamydia phocaeensis]|uniref:fasciclin domain-containing protein n=1 Tax=Candidatus Protochlamydia phocaeensis TaxID=1414722 RepID=UPI0008392D5E|nr:fasciclin domain-containing protein [Candidatus Protochlamydia phocaeensis]